MCKQRIGVACACIVIVVAGCRQDMVGSATQRAVELDTLIAGHIDSIKSGDLGAVDEPHGFLGAPYHVAELIRIGKPAAKSLLELLSDDTATPFKRLGDLSFGGPQWVTDLVERTATVGDVADYALRFIYATNTRYASHLPKERKMKAIEHWKGIVAAGESGMSPEDYWRQHEYGE